METQSEVWLRLGVFVAVLAVLAIAERLRPRRVRLEPIARRWATNLSIVAADSLLVRIMASLPVPLAAITAAHFASVQGWGLFNAVELPVWLEAALAVVVLDFAIWLQHLASHKIPALWRLHQVHHADRDIDVTTAIRFHPVEIGLSMVWKIAWVLLLGAPAVAVVLFEVILNACAMFSHANLRLPERVDRMLRMFIVTPDMHRVHHSVLGHEHDSNYGFNLSVWDRLFRTYTAQPENGHENMRIGLESYQDSSPSRLGWSLSLPFKSLPNQGEKAQTLAQKRT
jgi:sterol desaturase/sphingolipid hydroxylase (fatty acid hydroxylase superfamily)